MCALRPLFKPCSLFCIPAFGQLVPGAVRRFRFDVLFKGARFTELGLRIAANHGRGFVCQGHEQTIAELQATVVTLTSTVRALEARLGDLSQDEVQHALTALGNRIDGSERAVTALERLAEDNHTCVTAPPRP